MKKYPISDDFRLLYHYKAPMNNTMLPVLNFGTKLMERRPKSVDGLEITEESISTFDNSKLKVLVFRPTMEESLPCLVYFHGGAFVTKAISLHYELAKRYALEAKCVVVLPDYRLSPKYPYPIPEEDCFSTYRWVIDNAKSLNIRIDKIAIGGDSAGGSLCLSSLRRIVEHQLIRPCCQMLVYPVIDNFENRSSMNQYLDTPVWNAVSNHKMWEYHLNGQDFENPFDEKYMINSYIELAEYDCLHDEGKDYFDFLRNHHIMAELNETKGTIHGYDFILRSPITQMSIEKRIKYLTNIFNDKK